VNFIPGVFVVLFSASVVIFVFVISCLEHRLLARPDPSKPDRRKGFSNRPTAAVFVATVINFVLFSLVTGTQVAIFVVSIRKALILDIDYPLSEKLEVVKKVVWNLDIVIDWAGNTPVSTNLFLPDSVFNMLREVVTQRSHRHLEGLGHLPRSEVGNPPTIYSVDRSRR